MDDEKVNAQEDVVEQEEQTSEETQEETTQEETQDDSQESEDTVVVSKEKYKAMQRKAIAYDASKKTPQAPKQEDITNVNVQADELKLIAKGLSDEEIEQAKVVARGKNISLMESVKDPLFLSFQKEIQEKEKKEKAKLGASRGSGSAPADKSIKSGMSKEEHFKAWQEQVK